MGFACPQEDPMFIQKGAQVEKSGKITYFADSLKQK